MDQKRVKMHREWCKILFASGKKKFFPEKKLDIRCKLTFRKGCQKPQNIEGFSLENFSHFASPEFFLTKVRGVYVYAGSLFVAKHIHRSLKKNALEWLDHFDFMTFLQPKWGKKLIIKLGRILTFLQSVVSALTTDFFSYESFKKLRGGTGTKVLFDLRSCPLTLSRGFFFKIAAAKQQKNHLFKRKSFDEKPFPRLDESFKRDFLCISIHALKGLCYANDVSRRILLMTSLMTQPFLFCTNRQISRCELVSLW